ncbi:MAG: protein jag [Deltaproteobacteria bacterium]|nr:protein jag [Deltaproteobacteria bacterium]
MNKTIEIEGKNIDDAIGKACAEFDVPREKLNIEIIAEGSSGLLGFMGAKKASIRASIMSFDMGTEEDPPETNNEIEQGNAAFLNETVDDESAGVEAKELLEGILKLMNLDFPVEIEEKTEYVTLNIIGDGSGLIIGRGGQTLDAMQYILNKALGKNGRKRKRIVLDTERYRGKRENTLVALAEKLGAKAKRTKKPVTVNPMNAHDRRIVHLALQKDKDLTTKSRGEGNFRKIIIIPTKKG